MKQIINHLTDNDLYTFTCQYYILKNYPEAQVKYSFFDRNKRKYPKGFAKLLREQLEGMRDITLSAKEYFFLKRKAYFLPESYLETLKSYRFNPDEVTITQDKDGYLDIIIEGYWWRTIMWEMPILSTISELMNILNGYVDKYDADHEYQKSKAKMVCALQNGLVIGDMGTRRRFSFDHHNAVIKSFKEAMLECADQPGRFIGTSNVYFAMKYDLGIVGTMSHQLISFEENMSGLFECNYQVMKKFSDVYNGDNGIFLYDCFGDKIFFNNFAKKYAKLYDGLRVDSGEEHEQFEKIVAKYKSLGIDPATKSVVFSNALSIDKAIELHKYVNGRMRDSYGIGTHLCADVDIDGVKVPYSNIVIKLVAMRVNERTFWKDCIKLSCDTGKTLGNQAKCEYYLKVISEIPDEYCGTHINNAISAQSLITLF